MTISSFEALGVSFELSSVEEIANISAPGPQIKKVKTLHFFNLYKLKEKKVSLVLRFKAWSRDSH